MFDQLTRGSPGLQMGMANEPVQPPPASASPVSGPGAAAASAAMAASLAAAQAGHQGGMGLFPKLTAGLTAPSTLFPSYPPSSPFGILQQQAVFSNATAGQQTRDRHSDDEFDNESIGSSPSSASNKRKLSDDGDMLLDEKDDSGQPRDKR